VNADANILNCRHCGSEHLVRREGGSVTLESFARCPKCGRNDRVEKVSVILRSHSKDTDLVKSLAKPILPTTDPKPEPLKKPVLPPKPDLLPKPKPTPKPIPLPKPKLFIRKPKVIYLIIGLALLLITYVFALASLGILFDEFEVAASVFLSVLATITLFFCVLLVFLGLSAKKAIPESDMRIEQLVNNFDQRKFSITAAIIPFLLFFLSGGCILVSLFGGVFKESLGTGAMILAIGFIPAIIGLYILAMNFISVIIHNKNFSLLKRQHTKILDWEHANSSMLDDWKDENQKLLDSWETENSQILKNWHEEEVKILKEWEHTNKLLLQEWEEKQAKTLSTWYKTNTRWEKLYFCHRDDIVFIPGEGTYAPTDKIVAYLNQGTE